ncbi:MAG: SWIM zinc finger domain-containing protein [Chloroflexi bacterium]|nr:SWIM zinc finger domain-containing protein [Chloroflexota bacterium]
MTIHLTEEMTRSRANEQSYQKGREYYQSGAIYDAACKATSAGVVLTARCEGNSAPSYRVRAELDAGGVRSTDCSCPYDWDGDCKHVVALLLKYLHKPAEFSEQKEMGDLLADLEKSALLALIHRLVEKNPDLYDEIEMIVPALQVAEQSKSAMPKGKRKTQVSEETYRKQVRRVFKQSRYDGNYYDDWNEPAYIEDLEEIQETAIKFLEAGDAEGALIILRVLLEEALEEYDEEMDHNGNLAGFIQDLGMPMAEAILSAELDKKSHKALLDFVQDALDNLGEFIESSDIELILAALEHGWDELPDPDSQWDEYEEEKWMVFDQLQVARLNILKRQGRSDEYLKLAQKADPQRYALELIERGQLDDAIKSTSKLKYDSEMLSVAQKLREAGRLAEAIALAERGMKLKGNSLHELAEWLAPLEEAQGKMDMALLAYRVVFDTHPDLESYLKIKKLADAEWDNIRPALLKKARANYFSDVLVDIHLEEKEWDAAIKVAEKNSFSYHLLEKVTDAVIQHRPDWVIKISIKQAEDLIEQTQSKLYPAAARWLERAKKVYQLQGQSAEWKAYIEKLRAQYARRPSLQKAIAGL